MIIPADIRKSSRSVKNRIQSILSDSEFVLDVEKVYQKPLVANLRCGLWYIPPDHRAETCYFKSTDGHAYGWNFSTKRLNLHLLKFITSSKGVIIVDSTRRGKSMPDAFSKTIPIWCAVLNQANFGTKTLQLPRSIISENECTQIENRVDEWVEQLKRIVPDQSLYKTDKPLRPIWVTQDGMLPFETPIFTEFHPVILCTASENVQDGMVQRMGYSYVQGAGDDHELWAGSLTPDLLWTHPELWKDISDAELQSKIESIGSLEVGFQTIDVTPYLSISQSCSGGFDIDLRSLGTKKRAAKALTSVLSKIDEDFAQFGPKACIVCNEFEIGVAVCLLLDCLYFDNEGKPRQRSKMAASKEEVSKRLVPLADKSRAIPTRATINIIGSYLRDK